MKVNKDNYETFLQFLIMSVYTNRPALTTNNYNNWKFRMMVILRKKQCFEVTEDPLSKKMQIISYSRCQAVIYYSWCIR